MRVFQLEDMNFEQYYDRLNINRDEDKILILKNASFSWSQSSVPRRKPVKDKKNKGKSKKKLSKHRERNESVSSSEGIPQEPFMLKNISLEIGKEELIGIAGAVGSGKTSLLMAIIGEMMKQSGDIQMPEYLNSE